MYSFAGVVTFKPLTTALESTIQVSTVRTSSLPVKTLTYFLCVGESASAGVTRKECQTKLLELSSLASSGTSGRIAALLVMENNPFLGGEIFMVALASKWFEFEMHYAKSQTSFSVAKVDIMRLLEEDYEKLTCWSVFRESLASVG